MSDTALEGIILLVAEQATATEFLAQPLDGADGIIVGGVKALLLGSLFNGQSLVIIVVERVQRIGIIGDYVK